jgi:cupin 2 domain-containing protein
LSAAGGNIFADLPSALSAEQIDVLFSTPNVKIERIVSHGQASPEGFWYDQADNEWVMVVAGAASVLIEGEAEPRKLKAGDHLNIPAHTRHRVTWTDPSQPTIWLAVHTK